MKIVLLGYGKMGKMIEAIALERGHTIACTVSTNKLSMMETEAFTTADVAIDFSTPTSVVHNIHTCFAKNIPVVVGTTGWNNELATITDQCNQQQQALLHASNFSIGVNVFFAINKKLAQLMQPYPSYNISMQEVHHLQKLDAPSGTGISLANDILKNNNNYNDWVLLENKNSNTQIPIEALRKPDVVGFHSITYNSPIDNITISHDAHTRQGFAQGAVIAAEWLVGKKGVFTMNDVLGL
ncbi:MAG: 4-hydroxy-tetrahydrodipicolinate reductase [Bacteroidia bacterium]|nr:4-hydroxy-tetrahydrodipicolinate reductase [Bacteroidia bacterium]